MFVAQVWNGHQCNAKLQPSGVWYVGTLQWVYFEEVNILHL